MRISVIILIAKSKWCITIRAAIQLGGIHPATGQTYILVILLRFLHISGSLFLLLRIFLFLAKQPVHNNISCNQFNLILSFFIGKSLPLVNVTMEVVTMMLSEEKDFLVRPTNDLAFKHMLGNMHEGGEERLTNLIESILPIKVQELTYIDRDLDSFDYESRESVLDVRVMVNEHLDMDIEMQMIANQEDLLERALIYSAQRLALLKLKGRRIRKLHKVITIFFVRKGMHTEGYDYVQQLCVQSSTGSISTDTLQIFMIDLENYRKQDPEFGHMSKLDQWCYFLLHCHEDNEIMLQLRQENDVLKGAEQLMRDFTLDDQIKHRIYQHEAFLFDAENARERAREEGEATGMAKGVALDKAEIATRMLNEGVDLSFISRMTGLSEEEILKLK